MHLIYDAHTRLSYKLHVILIVKIA